MNREGSRSGSGGGGVGVSWLDDVSVQIPGGRLSLVYGRPNPITPVPIDPNLIEGLTVTRVKGVEVEGNEEGGVDWGDGRDSVEQGVECRSVGDYGRGLAEVKKGDVRVGG